MEASRGEKESKDEYQIGSSFLPLNVRVDQTILSEQAAVGLTVEVAGEHPVYRGVVIVTHWRVAPGSGKCTTIGEQQGPHHHLIDVY